ncbi:MAG: hypothetical protein ABR500_14595 [Dermatophilaceae bacterium]
MGDEFATDVDVWSTTYFHVLDPDGRLEDPVLERLPEAYPRTLGGVVLPFRRTFAVARKPD